MYMLNIHTGILRKSNPMFGLTDHTTHSLCFLVPESFSGASLPPPRQDFGKLKKQPKNRAFCIFSSLVKNSEVVRVN